MNPSPFPWSIHPMTNSLGTLHEVIPQDGSPSFWCSSVWIGSGQTIIAQFTHYAPSEGHPSPTHEEMQANARLAIAAPKLLEALKAIVSRAKDPALCDDTDALLDQARDAIESATGTCP